MNSSLNLYGRSGFVSLLNQLRHQASPSGLVGRARAPAVIAVKIFEKPQVVTEVLDVMKFSVVSKGGASTVLIFPEDTDQAVGKIVGNFLKREHVS